MWLVLIVTAICAVAWLNEPKKNAVPIRDEVRSGLLPDSDPPSGGISRLLDS